MKIAIVTLHRVYNYGSALQAYATQEIFEQLGHRAYVIDYVTPQRTKFKIFFLPAADESIKGVKSFVYHCAKIGSLLLKELTFGSFVRKNLHLTKKYITAEDIEKDLRKPIYTLPEVTKPGTEPITRGLTGDFLDFIPENCKRIAFVASFGKKQLDKDEVGQTKKYIDRYSGLSVREDSAAEILRQLGRDDAVQLIDPTLQLDKSRWIKLASKRLIKERYLILMLLYNEDNGATEYARKIADKKGLKLVKISWEFNRPKLVDKLMTHRSPADFLSLFNYADFVVTNSFHGLAFSINLEKQFIVVPRNEFNSRIESLLKLTGLENRMVASENELGVAEQKIDYAPVNLVLEKERLRAKKFIIENTAME